MKLFVLMVIHNRRELTLACLACIAAETFKNYQVVVVDDGSNDGSAEAIAARYPHVTILRGNGKLWWTAGMNMGLKHILAAALAEDYVLTLNDDTWFAPDYFEKLLKVSAQKPTACLGSLLRNYFDQTMVEDSGVLIDWNGFWFKRLPYQRNRTIVPVDTLSGRGTLVPVSLFKKIGLFNARRLPHYAADYEFFIRAARAGTPLYLSYEAIIFHHEKHQPPPPRPLWWRMFNRKSPSNLFNMYYILLRYSPGVKLKIYNALNYTWRSVAKIKL